MSELLESLQRSQLKEGFLLDIIDKMVLSKEENYIKYYSVDGVIKFELDSKKMRLWCSRRHIWTIFETKYGMKHTEIQIVIKTVVEKHLKWYDYTPLEYYFSKNGRWRST